MSDTIALPSDFLTLHVLADALGRIDYCDSDSERTRVTLRDTIAAAIAAQHTTALPSNQLSESEQTIATAMGWCMIACDDGQLVIEADSDSTRFANNTEAYDHVAAVAEHFAYPNPDYQELCQRALALCDESAPLRGANDTDALPSDTDKDA